VGQKSAINYLHFSAIFGEITPQRPKTDNATVAKLCSFVLVGRPQIYPSTGAYRACLSPLRPFRAPTPSAAHPSPSHLLRILNIGDSRIWNSWFSCLRGKGETVHFPFGPSAPGLAVQPLVSYQRAWISAVFPICASQNQAVTTLVGVEGIAVGLTARVESPSVSHGSHNDVDHRVLLVIPTNPTTTKLDTAPTAPNGPSSFAV
jgi:hypothetical protein